MFESDGKRLLAKRHQDKKGGRISDSNANSDSFQATSSIEVSEEQLMVKDYNKLSAGIQLHQKHQSIDVVNNKTVYRELKLSQILLDDVDVYKQRITEKNERLERQLNNLYKFNKQLLQQNKVFQKLKANFKQVSLELKNAQF